MRFDKQRVTGKYVLIVLEKLLIVLAVLFFTVSCGGGGGQGDGGGGNSSQPQIQSYTISSETEGSGTTSPATVAVERGRSTSFLLNPSEGYRLGPVDGCNGSLAGNTYTLPSVTEDCTFTARFVVEGFYLLNLEVGENGVFETATDQLTVAGGFELTLAPDAGYIVDEVTGCGGTLDGLEYSASVISEDCTITASFARGSYLVLQEASFKTLGFSWGDTPGATHYKLFENPDGISGFEQIATDIEPGVGFYKHTVPLHMRSNARYLLQVCEGATCFDRNTLSIDNSVLLEGTGYIKASNPDSADQFGQTVRVSGDGNTLAVATLLEQSNATGIDGEQSDNSQDQAGAVYLYDNTAGEWQQQAYVKASNTQAWDRFGSAIDLSADGSILAVGAPGEESNATSINGDQSDNSGVATGAVYVFSRTNGKWAQQAYIKSTKAPLPSYLLNFGISVSLDAAGETLAVGSPNGEVHLFKREGDSWSFQQIVSTEASGGFGSEVKLSADGNTLVMAGPHKTILGVGGDTDVDSAGAVYIYTYSGGVWAEQVYLEPTNPVEFGLFGQKLSLSSDGNNLAVGVHRENNFSGVVYVYTRKGESWSLVEVLNASNGEGSDRFGEAVSFNGDGTLLAVGAPAEDGEGVGFYGDKYSNFEELSGAVYLFEHTESGISETAYIKSKNSHAYMRFGRAVSLSDSGHTLVVSAPHEDGESSGVGGDHAMIRDTNSGAVYLY